MVSVAYDYKSRFCVKLGFLQKDSFLTGCVEGNNKSEQGELLHLSKHFER